MVVEELLKPLVGVVDAELLKLVDGEDLETSDIKDSNEEVLAGLWRLKSVRVAPQIRG